MFSLPSNNPVAPATTTTLHKHTKLPTNPAWDRGLGEAPKVTGPMALLTQDSTNVEALTVDFLNT